MPEVVSDKISSLAAREPLSLDLGFDLDLAGMAVRAATECAAAALRHLGEDFRGGKMAPGEIDLELVDPLMRPVVARINASGWVWTWTACQGHPDSYDARHHTADQRTYLGIYCRQRGMGQLMALLAAAIGPQGGFAVVPAAPPALRAGGWAKFLIEMPAFTAGRRDDNLACFARFAEEVWAAAPPAAPRLTGGL